MKLRQLTLFYHAWLKSGEKKSDSITKLSEGKLYLKKQTYTNKDEIGETVDTFNGALFCLRRLIIGVYNVTEKLGNTIGQLFPKAYPSGEAAHKVTMDTKVKETAMDFSDSRFFGKT